ncbi:MAG: extracellular elastinolytic metalloproteinase [Patiriisocius sp.]|jgi:extracellular elastinolytic metalloproteinase
MKRNLFLLLLFAFSFTNAQNHLNAIQNHFDTTRSQTELTLDDVSDFEVKSSTYSKSMRMDNVYVSQRVQGIEVFNSTSVFGIKNGVVVSSKIGFIVNSTQKLNTTTPAITAQNAIVQGALALSIPAPTGLEIIEAKGPHSFIFNSGSISLQPIPVSLVFQPMDDNTLRLAWDLSIYLLDASHYYSVRIDALTGVLLATNDWVTSCDFGTPDHHHFENKTIHKSVLYQEEKAISFNAQGSVAYRVFPVPFESPNHGPDMLVIDPANTNASPFGWHDTDGVSGPEYTITRGNNVIARDDIDNNNTGGLSPDGGSSLTFDFPFNFEVSPEVMLPAVTTNLFYWNNIMHDVYYQYGFDEASGNFQENNYGNGGTGTDFVDAQAQDGGGTNNANFSSPPDGNNPRMQMYLWDGPPGNALTIDGSLAGNYLGVSAAFGGSLPEDIPLVGQLILTTDDDAGTSTDPNDACDTLLNGAAINGNIAVIRRGECQFGLKILTVENEGAVAVIIINNVAGAPIVMAPGDVGDQVTIPAIMISQADGEAIIAALLAGEAIEGSLLNDIQYQLDGDVDNGIVAHEYGHGISTRLTGGRFNSSCLGNDEQMGEGWSDWFGLMLTMQQGDQGNDIRGIGTYATGQPTDGGGIREAPYSTDFSINSYTYDDTDGNVSVPHGVGFVWATMLWEMTWDLIEEYGFDSDLYTGTGGNNIAMQLVLDGLKLQPCGPGFVTGRDAILEADMLANDGANQCLIWNAFARRGLGLNASQGSANSLNDQLEAFDVPETSNCFLEIGERTLLNDAIILYPNPAKGIVNISAPQVTGDAVVSVFDINGRVIMTQNVSLNTTASLPIDQIASGVYLVKIAGEGFTMTTKLIVK